MSTRIHVFRMTFLLDGKPAGAMLIVDKTVELAISKGYQLMQQEVGKYPEILSIGRMFWSEEEELVFMNACMPKLTV